MDKTQKHRKHEQKQTNGIITRQEAFAELMKQSIEKTARMEWDKRFTSYSSDKRLNTKGQQIHEKSLLSLAIKEKQIKIRHQYYGALGYTDTLDISIAHEHWLLHFQTCQCI